MTNLFKPKVSIIIPVYNTEEFLSKCVDSLLSQTYDNIEIWLIDDGSKDMSPALCDAYAEKHAHIHTIHKENAGQGVARNMALDKCTGDYIAFVDSDDAVTEDYVEKMVAATDNGKHDLVVCGLTVDTGLRVVQTAWYEESKVYSPKEILWEYLTSGKIITGPVCKLIHKKLLTDLRFPPFRANEDAYIMHEFFGNCKSAYVLNEHLYVQALRSGSTERSNFNVHKMHLIDCAYALRSYVTQKYPEYADAVQKNVADACLTLLNKLYVAKNANEFTDAENQIKGILSEELPTLPTNTKTYKQVRLYLKQRSFFVLGVRRRLFKARMRNWVKHFAIRLKKSL